MFGLNGRSWNFGEREAKEHKAIDKEHLINSLMIGCS